MKRCDVKSKKGFTLVELLIALAIFTLVVTLAGTMFVSGFRNYQQVSTIMTGQANTRYVMYDLSKQLRNASLDEITINDAGTSITIGTVVYFYTSDAMTISKTSSDTTVVIANNISSFSVSLDGETISYSIESSDDSASLNSSVTLKEFSRPSPD